MIDGMSFGMNDPDGDEAVNAAISKYLEIFKIDEEQANEFLHNKLVAISLDHPEVGNYAVRQNIVLLTGELDFLLDDEPDDEILFFDEDECFGDDTDDDIDDLDMMEGMGGC